MKNVRSRFVLAATSAACAGIFSLSVSAFAGDAPNEAGEIPEVKTEAPVPGTDAPAQPQHKTGVKATHDHKKKDCKVCKKPVKDCDCHNKHSKGHDETHES